MKLRLLLTLLAAGAAHAAGDAAFFEQKVKPALEAKCVACHNPAKLKGDFDMTTRATLLTGGEDGSALMPGRPEDSPIYSLAIAQAGAKPEMPKKGEALSADEAEALRTWIAAGAVWPEKLVLKEKAKADKNFWSFQPVVRVEAPLAADAPAAWQSNPIDRFLFAKMKEQGLEPSPPADPRTLIRRATYDLTGLPPTAEEVEAFLDETNGPTGSDETYEKLIDRLLASPHYGEQWGRHWLDVVRFGESRGFERNQIITNLWPFRDYVIQSLNNDKPFDRLIAEHLAGDLLGKDQPEVEVGSAFLVAGPYDDVGNQDPAAAAQIRADQMDEMIRTTSEAFLGMTLGCARCHDHKFDPLPTRDYYAFYATFAGTKHGEREVASAAARAERATKLKPLEEQKAAQSRARAALQESLSQRAKAAEAEAAKSWTRPKPSRYATEEVFPPVEARFVRLIMDGSDANDAKAGRGKIDEFEVWSAEPAPRNVALASNGASARGESKEAKDFAGAYSAALTIDGKFGERWNPVGDELRITFAQPERIGRVLFSSDRNRALDEQSGISTFVGEYRLEGSLDGEGWFPLASSADRQPATAAIRQKRLLKRVTQPEDAKKLAEMNRGLAAIEAEIGKVPALPVWWVGTHPAAPGPFHVFIGGSPQKLGDAVVPASLSVFAGAKSGYQMELDQPEGERRLALARWLTAPENPLTPRVLANRVWHYHFGKGIVDTPSDFGYMGSRPTHPELLDWLAVELQREGWKLKALHRLIMTSAAYRQASVPEENAPAPRAAQFQRGLGQDSDARLLWRFPPRRLSAEEVRDTMLAVAGRLELKMGGPGFKLYEYQQDNVATYVPLDVHGPETWRRAVYYHNARAARVDVITDFDCPDPAFSEPRRSSTTTPLQALTLLNHRFSLDMAQAFSERLEREGSDAAARVQRAFAIAYGRRARAEEVSAATQLIEEFGLRAFCRVILNSNELINLN